MVKTRTVFTNPEVVKTYFDCVQLYGRNEKETIFFEGDTLYSYGYHFPLAVHVYDKNRYFYVLNGDYYSTTTSHHQSMVRWEVQRRGLDYCIIPFSALNRAEINPKDIVLIDKENDRLVPRMRKDKSTGEMVQFQMHLMGSTLFKVGESYFLSGLDDTARDPWRSFFLVELVNPCETVAEAYESMKPPSVKFAEEMGVEVYRQGEYFFTHSEMIKSDKDLGSVEIQKDFLLIHPVLDVDYLMTKGAVDNRHHRATKGCIINGVQYVKGYVRHTFGDHRQLHFDSWHIVHPNLVKAAYNSQGRID